MDRTDFTGTRSSDTRGPHALRPASTGVLEPFGTCGVNARQSPFKNAVLEYNSRHGWAVRSRQALGDGPRRTEARASLKGTLHTAQEKTQGTSGDNGVL